MRWGEWERQEMLFKIKMLKDRVEAFESGRRYVLLGKRHEIEREADRRTIRRLERELARERSEKEHVLEIWYTACEDVQREHELAVRRLEREHERKLAEKDALILSLQKDVQKERERADAEHEKYLRQLGEAYEAKTQLEEERGRNRELCFRINKDYGNSSKPSSMSPNHKTIHNGRESTGRRPGGQPGHPHHGRKRLEPTEIREIPVPERYLLDPNYVPTGRIISKQRVGLRVVADVIEYRTPEFRDIRTGQRVHADFPDGYADDVSYDGTVKGFAYIVNNVLFTSVGKTKEFLEWVSGGRVSLSTGLICNLAKQFSDCTGDERRRVFGELLTADVLHADFTFGRRAGKQTSVIITATDSGRVLYQGRERKGDEGVKGSPVEHYGGTLVSDHEAALVKHGGRHQECLAHVKRYAKSEAENEPEKAWGAELDKWIGESVGYWNEVRNGKREHDTAVAETHIRRFMEILEKARGEYEDEPPTDYYKEGYNTYRRMAESPEEYVLFLRDPGVPPTNNTAERYARKFKRKAHQVMSFRSQSGVDRFCDGLSITESIKAAGGNLFDEVSARFDGKRPGTNATASTTTDAPPPATSQDNST